MLCSISLCKYLRDVMGLMLGYFVLVSSIVFQGCGEEGEFFECVF